MPNRIAFLGITGGVGAGKSAILDYIETAYRAKVIKTDDLAASLMEPGTELYDRMRKAFSADKVYSEDGRLNRTAMADVVFNNKEKLAHLNSLVHPAVKNEIKKIRETLEGDGKYDYLIIEAALLIEDHYDAICDELWYIYASEETRKKRLMEIRGYSDEKTKAVMKRQLDDRTFREHCKRYIDNNGDLEAAKRDIDIAMVMARK